MAAISRNPSVLPEVCQYGTREEQIICIEGAIEKLADLNEASALTACAALPAEYAVLCQAAAQEKMYRLDKPTLGLYLKQAEH